MRSSQIAEALRVAIEVQRPLFLWGPPGVGKSDLVAQVATEGGGEVRDVRLGLMDPTDINA